MQPKYCKIDCRRDTAVQVDAARYVAGLAKTGGADVILAAMLRHWTELDEDARYAGIAEAAEYRDHAGPNKPSHLSVRAETFERMLELVDAKTEDLRALALVRAWEKLTDFDQVRHIRRPLTREMRAELNSFAGTRREAVPA